VIWIVTNIRPSKTYYIFWCIYCITYRILITLPLTLFTWNKTLTMIKHVLTQHSQPLPKSGLVLLASLLLMTSLPGFWVFTVLSIRPPPIILLGSWPVAALKLQNLIDFSYIMRVSDVVKSVQVNLILIVTLAEILSSEYNVRRLFCDSLNSEKYSPHHTPIRCC
jgi:hypothetical protein